MFKLILIVTILASQTQMGFEHARSPFSSEKECLAAIEKTRASTIEWLESQFGNVSTEFSCTPIAASLSEDDRMAADISRLFRDMISEGGFGTRR